MARRFFLSSIVCFALVATPIVRADQTPPEIANARNSAIGVINTDGVYVRSGAGDNYYPTTKLNKEAEVQIVGEKFDWLKIIPPANSFCYVAKAFIDKNANGTAIANRDDVNVRAGSELNTVKTTVQSKLANGQSVQILGEVDEYYKIAPPADAYVFIKKDFVELKRVIPSVAKTTTPPDQTTGVPPTPPATPGDSSLVQDASTQPAIEQAKAVIPAATNPAIASAENAFDKLEAEFAEMSKKEIEQQPIKELTDSYAKLAADPQLPVSMRQTVAFRLQTLKVRSETKDQFLAVKKQQTESKQKQVALKAEQEEIAQQIKQKDVKVFTAVGTLRTSSIQQGGQIMYRLTDPQTGRTVCYLRSDDPKYGTLLGQFIGVRGNVIAEPGLNLKVINATEYAPVDPNELYRGVAAQIVPASLLPQSAQQASATEQ